MMIGRLQAKGGDRQQGKMWGSRQRFHWRKGVIIKRCPGAGIALKPALLVGWK
ncbi:hypothetical protein GA0116948_10929 [Chitinophaga costaii]|uniref:Uncharacterized protein n=1 Tax=Chitinophaga costaii TaxID=1335309 RepID=A0A1C4ELY0_9BACT|nr:hypothetical protein [Chitinophaga costaii]SCC44656.1 hypothetical protein GA0116948_10929 [Chitinophaga costaii]